MNLPNFDGIARAYRWLEYLALGPLLSKTRNCHLDALRDRTRALILGDGDGRFTARLLAANPTIQVEAVDLSERMLALLLDRSSANGDRLHTRREDARAFVPSVGHDLVVTHFFLDCLSQDEVEALIARLTPILKSDALWVVSDFRIPNGPIGLLAEIYVRALYFGFRILTGLRVTRLPDHATALERSGFRLVAQRVRLFGMLTSEVWRRQTKR